jgi:hypothetical protein
MVENSVPADAGAYYQLGLVFATNDSRCRNFLEKDDWQAHRLLHMAKDGEHPDAQSAIDRLEQHMGIHHGVTEKFVLSHVAKATAENSYSKQIVKGVLLDDKVSKSAEAIRVLGIILATSNTHCTFLEKDDQQALKLLHLAVEMGCSGAAQDIEMLQQHTAALMQLRAKQGFI